MASGILLVGNFHLTASGCPPVGEELGNRLRSAGWTVLTTSRVGPAAPRVLDMVATVFRRRREYSVAQVDVFSGRAFVWAEAVTEALRAAGKPYVLTLHGGNLPAFSLRYPGRVRRLLRRAAAVTAPSRYLVEELRSLRPDLLMVPNGLPLDAYRFRLRERIRPRLLWLRAFHRIYNPELALAAVARLIPDFPDLRLTMVGPDHGDGTWVATQAKVGSLGLSEHVELSGRIPKADVPGRMDRADILLNTPTIDNAPVSVLEGLAAGLCVVSTNVGGIPYLLENGRDSLLVPSADPDAMALAIRRLLTEPGLAGTLSRQGRVTAERSDWSNVLEQWSTLLVQVTGSPAHA